MYIVELFLNLPFLSESPGQNRMHEHEFAVENIAFFFSCRHNQLGQLSDRHIFFQNIKLISGVRGQIEDIPMRVRVGLCQAAASRLISPEVGPFWYRVNSRYTKHHLHYDVSVVSRYTEFVYG